MMPFNFGHIEQHLHLTDCRSRHCDLHLLRAVRIAEEWTAAGTVERSAQIDHFHARLVLDRDVEAADVGEAEPLAAVGGLLGPVQDLALRSLDLVLLFGLEINRKYKLRECYSLCQN